MFVVHSINSFVGKTGNIGRRTGYIFDALADHGIVSCAIARGAVDRYKSISRTMGVFGQIPRLLNAYRIYVDINFNMRKYDIGLYDYFAQSILKRIIKKAPDGLPRILHSWELSPELLALAKREGFYVIQDVPIAPVKHALGLHEQGLMPFKDFDFSEEISKEEKCYSFVDEFIVPSDFVRGVLLRYGVAEEKISIVPFGCDITDNVSSLVKSCDSGVQYCFAGTINVRKGINFLLDAFSSDEFSRDRLHLCGRLFPEQAKKISALALNNVILAGFVDTISYFAGCDVYVFPSLMEGSSKSIYEAMATGMPVITTYNSGSIVRDGIDGFIVPIGDSESLKEKMLYFKENPEKVSEMGRNAFERVKEFPWSRYAERVVALYDEVARQNAG